MFKVQAVVLDTLGIAMEWLDRFCDEEHVEICEILTLNENSPIPVEDLPLYDNWDVLLVFENGIREKLDSLFEKIKIDRGRIIYALDLKGSLLENRFLASYMFVDSTRRVLRYLSYEYDNCRYALADAEGMTYINTAKDWIILPTMVETRENWSKDDMKLFYDLSHKYYHFSGENPIFCDIGANIGTTCLYFKKNVDAAVKILAFEPIAENYKMLVINAMLNDINITENRFVQCGLSDHSGGGKMSYNVHNPGASEVVADGDLSTDAIKLISFDAYVESENINPEDIQYFWIDVEGCEARFLKGASKTLERTNAAVWMEFSPNLYIKKDGEFELLMSEIEKHFKYFVFADSPEKEVLPVRELWKYKDKAGYQTDIFLIRDIIE